MTKLWNSFESIHHFSLPCKRKPLITSTHASGNTILSFVFRKSVQAIVDCVINIHESSSLSEFNICISCNSSSSGGSIIFFFCTETLNGQSFLRVSLNGLLSSACYKASLWSLNMKSIVYND